MQQIDTAFGDGVGMVIGETAVGAAEGALVGAAVAAGAGVGPPEWAS